MSDTITLPTCPDCGRPIRQQPSGWWSHEGLPDGCWRLSLDGPAPDDDREVWRAVPTDTGVMHGPTNWRGAQTTAEMARGLGR